jgi:oligosaccharide repeat unit polymerase
VSPQQTYYVLIAALFLSLATLYRGARDSFSPGVLFTAMCGLYTMFFPLAVFLGITGPEYSEDRLYGYFLAVGIALVSLWVVCSGTLSRRNDILSARSPESYGIPGISVFIVFWSLAGWALIALEIWQLGGIGAFLSMGYGTDRYKATSQFAFAGFSNEWLSLTFMATLQLVLLKQKISRALVVSVGISFFLWIYFILIGGGRSMILRLLMGVMLQVHYTRRKLKISAMVLPCLLVYIFLVMFGHARGVLAEEGLGNAVAKMGTMLAENPALLAPTSFGELMNPAKSLYDTTGGFLKDELWLGKSYFNIPLIFAPHAIVPNRPLTVGEWYVYQAEPDFAEDGGGLGLLTLSEGMLNFGYFGIFVQMCLLAVPVCLAYRWFSKRLKSGRYAYASICYCSIVSFVIFAGVRIDLAPIVKGTLFGYGVPLLSIALLRKKALRERVTPESAT